MVKLPDYYYLIKPQGMVFMVYLETENYEILVGKLFMGKFYREHELMYYDEVDRLMISDIYKIIKSED